MQVKLISAAHQIFISISDIRSDLDIILKLIRNLTKATRRHQNDEQEEFLHFSNANIGKYTCND